jgi:hypothetical protein
MRASRPPDTETRPANYTFVPGNLLFTAIPHGRWPSILQELMRVTRSGEWVELVDSIGLANGGPNVEQVMDWIRQLSGRRGVDQMDGSRIGDYACDTPLLHPSVRRIDWPAAVYGGGLTPVQDKIRP